MLRTRRRARSTSAGLPRARVRGTEIPARVRPGKTVTCSHSDSTQRRTVMAKTLRSLSGKVVFITGAARGIGRATATALVAEGARVAIGDLDEDLAKHTAKELGGGVFAIRLDVTDHAGFTAVLDEVEREVGPIDILINNAGVMPIGNFEDDSFESAYRQFSVNVFAVMHGTREAIKRMKPRGRGHIVNLASMAGVVPTPGAATYCASKHAVVGLCESLYWELRGTGIDL